MIQLFDCKMGYLYSVNARTFAYSVYVGDGNFIGIREKMGGMYLWGESHFDASSMHGTVKPIEEIERCPILTLEKDFVVCSCHQQPVVHWSASGIVNPLHFDGTPLDDTATAIAVPNQPLLDYLRAYESNATLERLKKNAKNES